MDAYRIVVEVLRFVAPVDVLQSTGTVHSVWTQASASRELWFDFLPPHTRVEEAHPRDVYKQKFTSSVFVVLEDKLLRFYVGSRRWTELPLTQRVEIDYESSVVKMDRKTLFVCGSTSRLHNTFGVSVSKARVKALQNLTPHRTAMGVVLYSEEMYAFCGGGSHSGNSQICTKFTVRTASWRPLAPSTYGRAFFNPCVHKSLIYLVGGTDEEVPAEVYSPSDNVFKPLSLKWEGSTIAVADGADICLITGDKVLRWKVGSKKKRVPVSLANSLRDRCYSGYSPVVKDGQAFVLLRAHGWVVQMDLSASSWVCSTYQGGKMPRRKGYVGMVVPQVPLAPPPDDS